MIWAFSTSLVAARAGRAGWIKKSRHQAGGLPEMMKKAAR